MHEQYGPAVCIAPNEVSFINPSAWKTIYSSRKGKFAKYEKNYDQFHQEQTDLAQSLFISSHRDHFRMRKVLLHAFTEQALRDQEDLIQKHIKTLVDELQKVGRERTGSTNMTNWYNWIAFDIVADLSFGEPFDTLTSTKFRNWVEILSQAWKVFSVLNAFKSIFPSAGLFRFLIPSTLITRFINHFDVILTRVKTRLSEDSDRADFLSAMVKNNNGLLTNRELISNATLLVAAGTETVATLLPALTYLLLVNPSCLHRATQEVRNRFSDSQKISLIESRDLEYLSACIQEALRVFPPVPEGLSRIVPSEGDFVNGHWIPGGVSPRRIWCSFLTFDRQSFSLAHMQPTCLHRISPMQLSSYLSDGSLQRAIID